MAHNGLTAQQVEESRRQHGENLLTPAPKPPLWKLFIEKFEDPVIRILLIAAFLSLGISIIHGEYYETIGIFCAIFLATGVSFWFEMDAAKKFDILNQVNDDTPVKVIREGQVREVGKREVVVGDIILLETGDEIPADAELLESTSMQVNESQLTGEPSIAKSADPEEFRPEATYPSNHALRGTTVIDGHGVACVLRVGDATEFGKVARQATEKSTEPTPLSRQLEGLAKLIGFAGFSLAVITFSALFLTDLVRADQPLGKGQLGLLGGVMIGLAVAMVKVWLPICYDGLALFGSKKKTPRAVEQWNWGAWFGIGLLAFAAVAGIGYLFFGVDPTDIHRWISIDMAGRILQHFMVAVTLIVVAVPEGLPMSVTLSLALSMRKMLKSNNLVRKMHACETMGATTVICTDKTGTLTKNQMSVGAAHWVEGTDPNLAYTGIAANTTANLNLDDPAAPKPLGNPTEGALLLWLHGQGVDYKALREKAKVVAQLPFSTRHKYMATLVEGADGLRLYVKGAPEIVLTKCSGVADLAATEQELLGYQQKAMRTLAFGWKSIEEASVEKLSKLSADELMELSGSGLQFIGFVAISDPVRDDVPAAVRACMSAGIGIKIVTGDTPGTAREIGRQIGLWDPATDGPENELTGVEWEALSDQEALERAGKLKIMSRARPMDKQRLVQLLQKRGEVVAVTGDGTNDAPALNFANVGLSMGTGTSVAKEASDITLLDDSFASIATAVMWGRSVYRNIQRFVLFQLTINVTAVMVVFLGSLLGFDLPLTVTQMLWVNLIMDTFAAGALASLPPDPREMLRAPRRLGEFIVSPAMRSEILITGACFLVALLGIFHYFAQSDAADPAYELSLFFTLFVMLQFWNMFNAKAYATGHSAFNNLRNCGGFLLVGGLIIIGQLVIVSFGGEVFRVVPLGWQDWLLAIAATSVVLWIGEGIRWIRRIRAN